MKASQQAIRIIKKWEGCHDTKRNPGLITAYLCPAGVPTIGFGSTRHIDGTPIYYADPGEAPPAETITQEEAEALLLHEIHMSCEPTLNRLVRVPLAQDQFDALVSFVFNVGSSNFANSTLLRLLNAGDYHGASDQLLRWIHGGGRVLQGLVERRQDERSLFLTGMENDSSMPILVLGEKGDFVEKLQECLNKHGFIVIQDGIFGLNTQEAVRAFQLSRGIHVDGIVGPRTWSKLGQ
jgi:lysozyme